MDICIGNIGFLYVIIDILMYTVNYVDK